MARILTMTLLAWAVIAVVACSRTTTLVPTAVAPTVAATLTATATQTRTPTLTPTTTPTATPTFTPTATPTVTSTPTATLTPTLVPTATPTMIPTVVDAEIPPTEWSAEAHTKDAAPNYAVVFPEGRVNQITITIAPADWEAMQANLATLLGARDATQAALPAPVCYLDGPIGVADENPIWVPATISFNGQTWEHVGLRFKGNASLLGAWHSGSFKLPFKLDFDEFEDTYPEIKNQRFYGFKQLALANNYGDPSCLRDIIAADVLQRAGLLAAEAAPYKVVLDYGAGPVALGLYTAIEVIDDTAIARHLGGDDGNIYQAEGPGASLREGSRGQLGASFQKENHEDAADWSDIERLYDVLHAPTRLSDAAAWRANLEAVFDVHSFLRWLAVAGVLQHWDTYGCVPHNYYLYHDPATDRLIWISWDHNQALAGGLGGDASVALSWSQVSADWPLIRYLLDDPVYAAAYTTQVREILPLFDPAGMSGTYQAWAALLAPRVPIDEATGLATAIQALDGQTRAQYEAGQAFIAGH